jgi:hypothetical protein
MEREGLVDRIRRAATRALEDVISASVEKKNWDHIVLLIEEVLQRLYSFVPHRVDIHHRIHDEVSPELIGQMLKNDAMDPANFFRYFAAIHEWVKKFGAVEDDKDVDASMRELYSIPEGTPFSKAIPQVLTRIHGLLDVVDKRMAPYLDVKQKVAEEDAAKRG